jgi:V/A-type H+-transporting ATPase subunit D
MGVKIPKMNSEFIHIDNTAFYGFFETCAKLDDAKKQFSILVGKLIELADLEGGIKSLAIEIEKTKRRVNVLENNLIPKLYATRKYIEMQLEEQEREDFFRRKRIKALMEAKKK